jgi:hypothetical protein
VTRLLFLLAGVAVFIYLFVQLGPASVLAMMGRIGWGAMPIATAYAAYQYIRSIALSACVSGKRSLSVRDALWIRMSGEAVQFLTFTGPFLAEPAKAWLLRGRGLTAVEGYAATLTEYLSYTSYQLPASSFQLPASSYQLPASSFQLPASGYQLPVDVIQRGALRTIRGTRTASSGTS